MKWSSSLNTLQRVKVGTGSEEGPQFSSLHLLYGLFTPSLWPASYDEVEQRSKKGKEQMTWSEIKQAVEDAGVEDDDDIALIQCENEEGDHTFHKMRLGKMLKLAERVATEKANKAAHGSAV